ncbi:MAG: formate dehydrogenase accessory sulfurtransferase FdhD [Bacteroidota bacterium]
MEPRGPVSPVNVTRFGHSQRGQEDLLAVEEPMEIRLVHGPAQDRSERSIAITMRTPGNDLELAAGFLHGEGLLQSIDGIWKMDWCNNVRSPEAYGNVVKVELRPGVEPDLERLSRNFYMSSSCGVCGKASMEALSLSGFDPIPWSGRRFPASWIRSLPALAMNHQTVFKHTGGLHAASIFGPAGELLLVREDVGRHNAVDKAVGTLFLAGKLPLVDHVLHVSGRAGFELVQKAVAAGVSMMVAVGAPSSLAVDLARRNGMTLVGFLRGDDFNVYSTADRILPE